MTEIPQDFIDIDANADHWVMTGVSGPNEGRRFPDPDLFCVPSTNAKSDMTEAMLSEIPGQDDTVTPLKLEEQRFYKFCMAFLMQDGNLDVPGGRYGRDTRDCAPIAIVMAVVMRYHNGEPISYYSLNSDMGAVVNSADSVTDLLSESQYILDDLHDSGIDVKELLGDAYTPQTPFERLKAWAEEHGVLGDMSDDDAMQLVIDEDEAEKLIGSIQDREPPFDMGS